MAVIFVALNLKLGIKEILHKIVIVANIQILGDSALEVIEQHIKLQHHLVAVFAEPVVDLIFMLALVYGVSQLILCVRSHNHGGPSEKIRFFFALTIEEVHRRQRNKKILVFVFFIFLYLSYFFGRSNTEARRAGLGGYIVKFNRFANLLIFLLTFLALRACSQS